MFEFRDALEFKNVPDKVKCYYLVENTLHKINPVVDESDQVQYGFMINNTPPGTPRPLSPAITSNPLTPAVLTPMSPLTTSSATPKCPFSFPKTSTPTPGINVTEATPTPSTSKRSSLAGSEPSFSRSPTPEEDEDSGLQMKPIEEHHSSSQFLDVMRRRSGLTPLTEDIEEEERRDERRAEGTGEQNPTPVVRKTSNASNVSGDSEGEGKTALRKVSDTSTESGIMSSGSKNSEGNGPEYKFSNSSGDVAIEEPLPRLPRSGSVSEKVKKFDTLARERQEKQKERQRKTGLSYVDSKRPVVEQSPDIDDHSDKPLAPDHLNTDKLRPERKSLDSIESTGSNDFIEP